jgi:hypothetical protein
MQKWEYQWFSDRTGDSDEVLQRLGEEGWELVSVVYNGFHLLFYMRRAKD